MNRQIKLTLAAVLLLAAGARANNVFLHDVTSYVSFGGNWQVKNADASQGSSAQTAVTATMAGPVASGSWPSTGASVIVTKTNGGTKAVWLTAPLSAGVTLSSTVTCHLWGQESSTAANSGYACEVLRWRPHGGVVGSMCKTGASAEWTGSAAVNATPPTCTASTNNVLAAGDRILIVIYNTDAGGTETANSRTMTVSYDGASGANGDSYVTFSQTVSFAADSNNYAPNRGATQ